VRSPRNKSCDTRTRTSYHGRRRGALSAAGSRGRRERKKNMDTQMWRIGEGDRGRGQNRKENCVPSPLSFLWDIVCTFGGRIVDRNDASMSISKRGEEKGSEGEEERSRDGDILMEEILRTQFPHEVGELLSPLRFDFGRILK